MAAALGYFIAAISPNMDMANAALPAYVTVLLFFVGLLLRNQDQPVYWRWFSYLDFLKYAWGAQMINQFEGSKAMALDFQTVRAPLHPTSGLGIELQGRSKHHSIPSYSGFITCPPFKKLSLNIVIEVLWPAQLMCHSQVCSAALYQTKEQALGDDCA